MTRSPEVSLLRHKPLLALLLLAVASGRITAQTPLGSDFVYQGNLSSPGLPTVTTADFRYTLHDAPANGTQIGTTLSKDNVAIVNGVFTLSLDFGTVAFQGNARWLEISVRSPAGAGGYTTLSPRQALTATPNATYSLQTRGITVDATGQVGIGTATPGKTLTVAGDMELGTALGDIHQMRIGGQSSHGFLFSSSGLGEGLHLAYNQVFQNQVCQTINTNEGRSQLSLGYGSIELATAPANGGCPSAQFKLDQSGAVFDANVGIGTPAPEAKLHVNGSIRVDVATSSQSLTMFDENEHLMWALGQNISGQPAFFLISPVTSDLEAGFYRDEITGNGVMFADDKNFRAPNPADASTDIWYCCPEGPEAALYVRGTARLTNGRATIELPDHFRNLASEPGMTVQLTPLSSESKGLAAVKKRLDGIQVVELGGGTGNYEFDWRVEAVRKGWEDYKVIRPWLQSDADPDKAWQNRLKHIEERRAHGKPSPVVSADMPRPSN